MNNDVSAMVVMAILFLVSYAWISLIARVLRGNAILAFEPRRETPWGLIAVVLSFIFLIFCQLIAASIFGARPDVEPTVTQTGTHLTWTAVSIVAATLISIGLIHLFAKARSDDFGISFEHIPHDFVIGIGAFLVLGPVTFAIQFVFVKLLELESHHPLIELLQEDTTGALFGIVTVLAVVVAPISEEYFFRVLLQGWLERHFLFAAPRDQSAANANKPETETPADDQIAAVVAGEKKAINPYSPPEPLLADQSLSVSHQVNSSFIACAVPIVISSAVFALMHWSHGPDPAALFVLAIGLGYLYQRTHRWLPCVVTHACLNGTTMALLWFGLDQSN